VSHSWIERAQARFAPRASAGVVIGKRYVGSAQIDRAQQGWCVQYLDEAPLDEPLFTSSPSARTAEVLVDAITRVAETFSGRYLPVHVSVPDTVMRMAVFELDELPKTRDAQIELVRWRLSKDFGNEEFDACDCQSLGVDDGKQLLFAMGLDKAWHRCLVSALNAAGVSAWTLSADVIRQFNRYHDQLIAGSGALLSITPDTWTLWVWDNVGRPRFVRTRWRSADDDYAEEVNDIERAILAYTHGSSTHSVDRLYVIADGQDDTFVDALNSRLHRPCTRLSASETLSFSPGLNPMLGSAASSMAAALEK
jgi:hypothetical protein